MDSESTMQEIEGEFESTAGVTLSDDARWIELKLHVAVLERSLDKLLALEAAGVDNWDGYDFAMEQLDGED